MKTIELIETHTHLGYEVLDCVRDIEPNNGFLNNEFNIQDDQLEDFLKRLVNHAQGIDLPEGWVPYTTFWLFVDQKPVGISRLRHSLNDYLRNVGGHIGYAIRRTERGKGWGTQILKHTLEKAEKFAFKEVLLTCDSNNVASSNIIISNGGVLLEIKNGINYYQISI